MPEDIPSQNAPKLDTPAERMAFMKAVGAPEGFYIVSAKELFAIQQGSSKLHGQIRNWQVFAQAVFGVTTAEEALEVVKRQKAHRQGIMDDRMRYRATLMTILTCPVQLFEREKIRVLARDAINNIKPEGKE